MKKVENMEQLQRSYAKLIVCRGAAVRPGQPVVIQVDVEAKRFAELLAEEAYQSGAGRVEIIWSSERLDYLRHAYETRNTLTEIPMCEVERLTRYLRQGASYIRLVSQNPRNLEAIDGEKRGAAARAVQQAYRERQALVLNHAIPWCIAAVPGEAWAKLVYSEQDDPVEAVWRCITSCCYCERDPLSGWDEHIRQIKRRLEKLNDMELDRLCFSSENGTDLTVGLCEGHRWSGGDSVTPAGTRFSPNLPSEEVYTVPHRARADGTVVSTRPLAVSGAVLSEGFRLTYEHGSVVEFSGKSSGDQEILAGIFKNNPGARRLGEVALVDHDNPIGKSGKMFYSTLFDENASCHLAMGNGILTALNDCLEGEPEARGLNRADIHLDYMIGTEDMRCVGVSKSNKTYLIMERGKILV